LLRSKKAFSRSDMAANQMNHNLASFIFRITLSAALATLVVVFRAGRMVIPIRTQARTRGASTETREQVNLEFIKKGVTGRDEIARKLAWMNTGVNDDRLFIGRWSDSRWEVFWIAGGYYAADAGWNRKWNTHDLFVKSRVKLNRLRTGADSRSASFERTLVDETGIEPATPCLQSRCSPS
jgi:hypothetical protein